MTRVRNEPIGKGINKLGRSQMLSKSGRWRFFKKGPDGKKLEKKAKETKETKKTKKHRTPKLRASITPGTVLILLAGRFRGNRVVFLKQLESGLLLVTGPYKINGVPTRRVNQAYVIATSTKVDISKVQIPEEINDEYFARVETPKNEESKEAEFFNKQNASAPVVNQEWLLKRKQGQKAVDTAILATIKETPHLADYLSSKFTLSKHQAPHKMVF